MGRNKSAVGFKQPLRPVRAPASVARAPRVPALAGPHAAAQGPIAAEARQGHGEQAEAAPAQQALVGRARARLVGARHVAVHLGVLRPVVEEAAHTAHARAVVHDAGRRAQALVAAQPALGQGARAAARLAPAFAALPADDGVVAVRVGGWLGRVLLGGLRRDGGQGAPALILERPLREGFGQLGPERSLDVFVLPARRPRPRLRQSYEPAGVSVSAILFHVAAVIEGQSGYMVSVVGVASAERRCVFGERELHRLRGEGRDTRT